jgi:hypothetical protein
MGQTNSDGSCSGGGDAIVTMRMMMRGGDGNVRFTPFSGLFVFLMAEHLDTRRTKKPSKSGEDKITPESRKNNSMPYKSNELRLF